MHYNWRFGMYFAIPLFIVSIKNILQKGINKRGFEIWIIPLFVLLECFYMFKGIDNGEGMGLLSRHFYIACIAIVALGINLNKQQLIDISRITLIGLSVYIFINLAYYIFMYRFYTDSIFDCLSFTKKYLTYDTNIDASMKFLEWSHSNHHGINMWVFTSVFILSYLVDRKYRILQPFEMLLPFLLIILFAIVNHSRYGFVLMFVSFTFIGFFEMNRYFKGNIFIRLLTKATIIIYELSMILSVVFIERLDINRYHIYANSFETIRKYHFLGAGTGFDSVIRTNIEGHESVPHSHNLYISSMVDTGFFGVLLWLFLFLFLMYKGYSTRNHIMLAFALIIYPFTFVDSPTYVMLSVPVFFIVLSIAMSIDKKELPL